MEDKILVTISGTDATVDLLNDRIRLHRVNNHTIEILFSTITSIKIDPNHLQIFTAASSESIAFPATRSKTFELFKLELERVLNAPNSSLKGLLVLEKLGELKEKGLVSEDEFNVKKQQVLGVGIDPTNIEAIKKAMESAVTVEEEKSQRILEDEIARQKQPELNKLAWRNFGIVLSGLFFLVGLVASATGCFINGFLLIFAGVVLTPLIHHLVDGLSQGRINHVPLAYRLMILPVVIILSTFSYFRLQPQTQAATESTTSIAEPKASHQYEIVKTEDTSFKIKDGHYGLIPAEEMAGLPTVKRMVYRVLVPFSLSRDELKATIDEIITNITTEDPDIDEFRMFVYNDKAKLNDKNSADYVARVEWVPGGSYANMTEDIARNNNRESYQKEVVIADDLEATQKAATSNVTKFGLSEATRKQAYKETMANTQRATDEADQKYPIGSDKNLPYQQSLLEKYDRKTQKKYHLTEDQLLDIAVEGDTKHWPKSEAPILD